MDLAVLWFLKPLEAIKDIFPVSLSQHAFHKLKRKKNKKKKKKKKKQKTQQVTKVTSAKFQK